jgi:5'-nucleotidase
MNAAASNNSNVVSLPLIVGVTTRAMFDLAEEHSVFELAGVEAYAKLQLERENDPLKPGAAFEVARRLLSLNPEVGPPLVDVILLSRNSPDLSLRAFRAFEKHQLAIKRGSFTSGRTVAPFVRAWKVDLFLSNDENDVLAAQSAGTAAARLGTRPEEIADEPMDEVRFAFDGDAVVFSSESDQIFKDYGLDRFLSHERENAKIPMNRGPFGKTFLPKLALLRKLFMRPDGTSRVRIAIVTARNAPAHERVVLTLRAWGTPADEAHFVGLYSKTPILEATRAHIYFDDQERHVTAASDVVAAGLVPLTE